MTCTPISYTLLENGDEVVIAINALPGLEKVAFRQEKLVLELAKQEARCIDPLPTRVKELIPSGKVFVVEFGVGGSPIAEHEIEVRG